jgi:UDPglucose 6-dehydrogenase
MAVPAASASSALPGNSRERGSVSPVLCKRRTAADGAHALVVLTEWDEFKSLDFAKIFAGMQQPAFVFDGRNILDLPKLRALGFRASGIGK